MAEPSPFNQKVSWHTVSFLIVSAMAAASAATFAIVNSRLSSSSPNLNPANAVSLGGSSQEKGPVAALGRLEPQGEVLNISAPAFMEGARVEQLLVQVGERVRAGQVIATLDRRDRLQAALERAQTQVEVAQARLQQVRAGAKVGAIQAQKASIERLQAELQGQVAAQDATLDRLQAEWQNAQTECGRYQKLYRDGAISTSSLDSTCLKADTLQEQWEEARATRSRTVETLRKQLAGAQSTLEEIAEVRPVDLAVAQSELAEARAAVRQAQADLDLAYVRTPRGGQVLKIQAHPGELVGPEGVLELGNTDQMYVIAEVYETDVSRVKLGQRATVTSRGLTGELSGTVDEIGLQIGKKDVLGTDPAADADARVVEVKIRLDAASSQQVSGLTNLQVNVAIAPH